MIPLVLTYPWTERDFRVLGMASSTTLDLPRNTRVSNVSPQPAKRPAELYERNLMRLWMLFRTLCSKMLETQSSTWPWKSRLVRGHMEKVMVLCEGKASLNSVGTCNVGCAKHVHKSTDLQTSRTTRWRNNERYHPPPTHPIPDKQHQGQEDDTKTRSETAHGLLEALTPKTYPCWRNFITSDSCQKDASYCHIYDLWLLFPDEFTGGSLHPVPWKLWHFWPAEVGGMREAKNLEMLQRLGISSSVNASPRCGTCAWCCTNNSIAWKNTGWIVEV